MKWFLALVIVLTPWTAQAHSRCVPAWYPLIDFIEEKYGERVIATGEDELVKYQILRSDKGTFTITYLIKENSFQCMLASGKNFRIETENDGPER